MKAREKQRREGPRGGRGSKRVNGFAPVEATLQVRIRLCQRRDLRQLEWEGLFRSQRRIINGAFRRQELGQNVMLVAECNHAIVGQVWIDLERVEGHSPALIWAMRVIPWLRGLGIGAALLEAAEAAAARHGFGGVQLTVAEDNTDAQRFYRRAGFKKAGRLLGFEPSTTTSDRAKAVRRPQIVMGKAL